MFVNFFHISKETINMEFCLLAEPLYRFRVLNYLNIQRQRVNCLKIIELSFLKIIELSSALH